MDVQFITTSSDQLANLPIVNGQIIALFDKTGYYYDMNNKRYGVGSGTTAITSTSAAGAAVKLAEYGYSLFPNSCVWIAFPAGNTYAGAISLNVNSTGAKAIYINQEPSSADNYQLNAGVYLSFYDGTAFYLQTDGKLPFSITGSAEYATTAGSADVASAIDRIDITGQTIDLNDLTLSDGSGNTAFYICKTNVGAGNISNLPVSTAKSFILDVQLVNYSSNYFIARQWYHDGTSATSDYCRMCTNGSWGDWIQLQYGGGGTGGGHVIVDQAGTTLAQEENLQFVDAHLEDDSSNDATVVEVIKDVTKAQLQSLGDNTDGIYHTTDEPDGDDAAYGSFRIDNQTLSFTNLVATVSDNRVEADTLPFVFVHPDSEAAYNDAQISASVTAAGAVTFTASSAPSGTIVVDILCVNHALSVAPTVSVSPRYTLTLPTTGYTEETVTIWGESKTVQVITLTEDENGDTLDDFVADMIADYPINISGSLDDFKKVYALEIGAASVTFYLTAVPTAAFDVLVREA